MGESITDDQFRNLLAGSDDAFRAFFTARPQLIDALLTGYQPKTPLAYTAMMAGGNAGTMSSGSLSKFKYLLSTKKVDVNGRKRISTHPGEVYNPLCAALFTFMVESDHEPPVLNRTLEVMELLLQAGANVNVEMISNSQTTYGEQTPLMFVCKNHFPEAVPLFLRYKARVNEANSKGKTPLMFTVFSIFAYLSSVEDTGPQIKQILKTLLDAGAFIDAQDEEGKTALMYAVLQTNPDAVKFLIQRGANISLKNRSGQTAFDLATPQFKEEMKPFFKDSLAANEFKGAQALPPDVTSLVGSFLGAPSKPARQPPNTAQQKQTVLGELKATPSVGTFPGGTDYQQALARNPQGGRRTRKARKHKKKRKYTRKYK